MTNYYYILIIAISFLIKPTSLLANHATHIKVSPLCENSNKVETLVLTITTTSKSNAWSPAKVVKSGDPLTWKANASGMTEQIIITNTQPIFDLSPPRNSPVTITAIATDGDQGFTELNINSLNITSLDISKALGLTSLSCTDNQITQLDAKNNSLLKNLFCHSNQLNSLDISQNEQLNIVACFYNNLTELDLTKNQQISLLSCSNNLLKNLDLSNNVLLTSLECNFNQLENLNIKNGANTNIQKFNSSNNSNLFCIQVDDVSYSETNWTDIDSWVSFNKDCTFTNENPIAVNDSYNTDENLTLTIVARNGVLSNDTDEDEDVLLAVLQTNATNGILDLAADGSFSYIPNPGFYGTDSFTYLANDGELDSSVATVTIAVSLVNFPPVAAEDNYIMDENKILDINVNNGILANDTDDDNDILFADLQTDVSSGILDLAKDGSFRFTPSTDFSGTISFSYRAFDNLEYSGVTQVNISVEAGNDIVVPNGFTPNQDGFNDTFRPVFKGMQSVLLEIYDTWGNLIYVEKGQNLSGWNGTLNNKTIENGNYLYKIEAITNKNEKVFREGLFTLIK